MSLCLARQGLLALCAWMSLAAACAVGSQKSPPAVAAPVSAAPRSDQEAHQEVAAFIRSASLALKHAYDDDREDAAPLLTAWHHLNDHPALEPLRARWREPLALGLMRCRQLSQQSPRLRALRQAFANAYVDEMTGTLEGVDAQACRLAWQPLENDGPQHLLVVVTIEPWGTHPLSVFKQACRKRRRLPPSALPPSSQLPWSALQADMEATGPSDNHQHQVKP